MTSGKTSTGFEFTVNENIRTDWRFIKTLAEIEGGNDDMVQVMATVKLVDLILGEEGERKLCDHVKEKDGTVPTKALMSEVAEILRAMKGETKNS